MDKAKIIDFYTSLIDLVEEEKMNGSKLIHKWADLETQFIKLVGEDVFKEYDWINGQFKSL